VDIHTGGNELQLTIGEIVEVGMKCEEWICHIQRIKHICWWRKNRGTWNAVTWRTCW